MLGNTVHGFLYFTALLLVVVEGTCNCIKCGSNSECLEGCKPGFAGQTCDHECSRHCVDSLCGYDASTGTFPCSIGCTPGYYGLHCNIPCHSTDDGGKCDRFSGTSPDCQGSGYGNNCTNSCKTKCHGLVCDNKGKCFEEFCISGRYGVDCSKLCEDGCELCHKDTGNCLKLYEDIPMLYNSSCSCDTSGAPVKCENGYLIATIILVVLFGTAVFAIIWVYLCCIRNKGHRGSNGAHELVPMQGDDDFNQKENLTREELKTMTERAEHFKQKENQMREELKRMTEGAEQSAKETYQLKQELHKLGKTVSRNGEEIEKQSGVYKLHHQALKELILLNCTNIEFSRTMFNAEKVHINAEGELINKPQPSPPYSDQRLEDYTGASSTALLPKCGSPQYFEVKSRVAIDTPLTGKNLLLEIGLAREGDQDQSYWIGAHYKAYSLTIARSHSEQSICRMVFRHQKCLTRMPDTLENTPGTSAILHYGVIYDIARSLIAFLDVKKEQIIGKIDNVDTSVAHWPMFGIYHTSGEIGMSLIVGKDINMTDKKKELILESLS